MLDVLGGRTCIHGCTGAAQKASSSKKAQGQVAWSVFKEKLLSAHCPCQHVCYTHTHAHTEELVVYVRGERPVYGTERVNHCV